MLINDHIQVRKTPVSSMTMPQLQNELAELQNMQVDEQRVPAGPYRVVVENTIQRRIAEISNAIQSNNYQKEV